MKIISNYLGRRREEEWGCKRSRKQERGKEKCKWKQVTALSMPVSAAARSSDASVDFWDDEG